MSEQFFAITGGPGAGKTALIEALRAKGYPTAPEAGRSIVIDQKSIGRPDVADGAPELFAELMLSWDMRSHRWARTHAGPVFFDHAVPCVAGFYRVIDRPVPPHVTAAVRLFRYARIAFVAPPWPEIYRTDNERRATFEEATRIYEADVAAYWDHGYDLVELPRSDVVTRVDFVLDHVFRSRVR